MSVYTNSSSGLGVVSCDWFSMSCKLGHLLDCELLPVPDGWTCLRLSPTAVWGCRWYILDMFGNKVATFLASPRTPKIPANSANIQIANRFLYYDDFRTVTDKVLNIAPLSVSGLNRVDLCCDFEMTEQLWGTYLALARKEAKLKGISDSIVWWKTIKWVDSAEGISRKEIPNQINWGGKESTFKWKVYYKWLELETAPPEDKKPWIVDTWRAHGFNERHVWRVEVSISNTNSLCSTDGAKILPFQWFDDRVRLFCDIYHDKFRVRLKQGHKDTRHDKELPFLEIDGHKSVKHALPSNYRDDSDPEKRVACKLWAELQNGDTNCNNDLANMLRENLRSLLEKDANVWVIQRMYGVTTEQIADCVCK